MADEVVASNLLAHWVYRRECLWRDLFEAKQTLDKLKMDRWMSETFTTEVTAIESEIEFLKWLHAEAEFTAILLEVQARYPLRVVAPEPWLGAVKP